KPQTIFLMPVVAGALLWRRAGAWRAAVEAAASAAAVCVIVMLPFLARGSGFNVAHGLEQLARHNMLSGNAANVWWIAGWLLHASSDAGRQGWWAALTQTVTKVRITDVVALGWPNPRMLGTIAVAITSACAFWRMRSVQSLAAAA